MGKFIAIFFAVQTTSWNNKLLMLLLLLLLVLVLLQASVTAPIAPTAATPMDGTWASSSDSFSECRAELLGHERV